MSKNTNSNSYNINATHLLFDGFKTINDAAQAEQEIKSSEYNYRIVSSDVRFRLRTTFVELLKTQELMNITKDILERRKQNLDLVKMRYEAGKEHKGSLLTSKASLSQAEFEFVQVKRNLELAQRQLNKELGRSELVPVKAKGDFEIINNIDKETPKFENLANDNYSLQKLIAQKESAKFGLESAKAAYYPKINVSSSFGNTSTDWTFDKYNWSIVANLSFPLFEGGRTNAEIAKNEALINQMKADEKSTRNNIILNLEDSWTKLQNAIGNLNVQKNFLNAALERAKIAEAQYSNGLVSFDNWTIIEDGLVNAEKSFINAQAERLNAETNWIHTKGGTLDYEKEK